MDRKRKNGTDFDLNNFLNNLKHTYLNIRNCIRLYAITFIGVSSSHFKLFLRKLLRETEAVIQRRFTKLKRVAAPRI